ncbi:hypothetical protein ACMV6F_27630, partial [Pseudomonas putida]
HLFDFAVGSHHGWRAPERNRERSIGHQVDAWNVGMMDPLQPSRRSVLLKQMLLETYEARSAIHEPHLLKDRASAYRGISGEQFHGSKAS